MEICETTPDCMFEYREENLDKNRTVGDLTAQDNVCSFNYRDCKYWFSHRYRQYGLYHQTLWCLEVIGIQRRVHSAILASTPFHS